MQDIRKREEVSRFLLKKYSKVLEIGCSKGLFTSNLNINCEYWGIEPDKNAMVIQSPIINKILRGTYLEVYDQLPNEYFDLIICNDVIEHMPDHNIFFQSIKKKMKNNSVIIGSIPNVRYILNLYELFVKKDWQYKNCGILDNTHLRFFTKKSIKRTFLNNNFKIEKIHGINGIRNPSLNKRPLLKCFAYMLYYIINLGPLGFYGDILFPQFGFRIKNK